MGTNGMLLILKPDGGVEHRFWTLQDFRGGVRDEKSILLDAIFMGPHVEYRIDYKGHPRWAYVDENWRNPIEDVNPQATQLLERHFQDVDDPHVGGPTVYGPMVISFPPWEPPPIDYPYSDDDTTLNK